MTSIMTTIVILLNMLIHSIAPPTHHLTITVSNAKKDEGKMLVSLHNESSFMKSKPVKWASLDIENGIATVTFEHIHPGEYAVVVLHDLNQNNQMDFENSMPLEDYATSGTMSYGPPVWNDAKFILDKDTQLTLRL